MSIDQFWSKKKADQKISYILLIEIPSHSIIVGDKKIMNISNFDFSTFDLIYDLLLYNFDSSI